jgi:hypothetical protein
VSYSTTLSVGSGGGSKVLLLSLREADNYRSEWIVLRLDGLKNNVDEDEDSSLILTPDRNHVGAIVTVVPFAK